MEKRSTDFDLKAQQMEQERDQFATKSEEMTKKYAEAKLELEQTLKSLEDM